MCILYLLLITTMANCNTPTRLHGPLMYPPVRGPGPSRIPYGTYIAESWTSHGTSVPQSL